MEHSARLLTVKEVADRFGVTVATVRRWIKDGRLHGRMPGGQKSGYRIPVGDVERLVTGEPMPEPARRPSRLLDRMPDDAPRRQHPAGLQPLLDAAERCRQQGDLAGAARWARHAEELLAEGD